MSRNSLYASGDTGGDMEVSEYPSAGEGVGGGVEDFDTDSDGIRNTEKVKFSSSKIIPV